MGNSNTRINPRKVREGKHLTIDEAGRRAKVERSRLSRYERGYLRLRGDELIRLARTLHVAPGILPSLVPVQMTPGK
jgi:transcriptional regulator with XRE-family HTH domain